MQEIIAELTVKDDKYAYRVFENKLDGVIKIAIEKAESKL